MLVFQFKIEIKTDENWSDSRFDSVCEAIESELDNLGELIQQKLDKIPEAKSLYVEVK